MASRPSLSGRWARVRQRLAAWNARTFRQRQIIVRSDDRIHAVKLSTRLQQTVAGVIAATLLWSAASVGLLLLQSGRIDGTRSQLAEAERAYGDLLAEVQRARAEVIGLSTKLQDSVPSGEAASELEAAADTAGAASPPARPRADGEGDPGLPMAIGRLQEALDSLAERNGRLSDKLASAEQDLKQARDRAAELSAERVRVAQTLERTQQALADAKLDRVTQLRDDLKTARSKRQASQQGRLNAESRLAELEERLQVARERETTLQAEAARLQSQLEQSEQARTTLLEERRTLASKVGRLERALGEGAPLRGSLGERIAGMEKALLAAETRGDKLARERERLKERVASLKDTIDQLQARQSGLVERASARTMFGLETLEKTIAMTGLDVDSVAERVRTARSGTGGPFVLASLDAGDVAAERAAVERLDQQMQRLVALQTALGSMPLTAPVDSYWVSSHFGKRKDPYNGRWAMHEGVDLAAAAGSPVVSAAPGRVVFAGTKSGYGRVVEIDHGFGIRTRYAHLRSVSVEQGQRVEHRQTVGALGSSGRSTGPHVHYEVRVDDEPKDPQDFLKAGKHAFKG
mgnify:CR=1 FL=1